MRSDLSNALARELSLRRWMPEWGQPTIGNYDPTRVCALLVVIGERSGESVDGI